MNVDTKGEVERKFQKAFPIADLWMVACALLGDVGLLTEQTYGLLFSMLAASSLIIPSSQGHNLRIENKLNRIVGHLA